MSDLDWQDYVNEAVQTAPDQPPEMLLAQGMIGLGDEVVEYRLAPHDEARREEAGDVCWYLAAIAKGLAETTHRPRTLERPPWEWLDHEHRLKPSKLKETLIGLSGEGEAVGWQQLDPEKIHGWVFDRVGRVANTIHADESCDLESVLAKNIEKLRDRHGQSFSEAGEQER